MTVVKVLIGVAGVGKSTYIEQHKTEKSLVLSSDELRIELFKAIEQLGYNSEWTEEEDMTSIMNLKVVEEDLKKRYESLWLNIHTERKVIDLSTFYHVQKGVFNNQKVAYGTMLKKSEYIHNGYLYI